MSDGVLRAAADEIEAGADPGLTGEALDAWNAATMRAANIVRNHEAGTEVELLRAELADVRRERDEARSFARGYEHGYFDTDTDNLPGWLSAPLAP